MAPTNPGSGVIVTRRPLASTVPSPDTLVADTSDSPPGVSSGSMSSASTSTTMGVPGPNTLRTSAFAIGATFAFGTTCTVSWPVDTPPLASDTWYLIVATPVFGGAV